MMTTQEISFKDGRSDPARSAAGVWSCNKTVPKFGLSARPEGFSAFKLRYLSMRRYLFVSYRCSCIDSLRGTVVEDRLDAHKLALTSSSFVILIGLNRFDLLGSSPINRITNLFENLFATGDDDGVIKVS